VFETRLSLGGGVVFLVLGFIFCTLLAFFGSMLWGFIPYWPLFMLTNLAALYVGWWGVVLATIAPVATVIFQDSGSVLLIPVNFVQVTLFLSGMRFLRVDKGARKLDDRVKLVAVSAFSSAVGASFAVLMRVMFGAPVDESFHMYVLLWTIENVIPVLVPGLWLHAVMAETTEPFIEKPNAKPVTWMRRMLEYVLPWIATLIVIGVMIVIVLLGDLNERGTTNYLDFWNAMLAHVQKLPAVRVIALVLSIAMLYSVGSAVRHAKQSWTLVEAVRRHLPSRRLSELVTGGGAIPTEQRLVTVVFTDLRGFTETSAQFEPGDLVIWLNSYFTHMGAVIERHGGVIDKFIGDGIMIVFGLQSPDAQARQAMLCSLDMLIEIEAWQKASVARGLPAVNMGVGIHTGIVTAGEIGSAQRKQYTVIGSVVNTSARLESASKGVPDGALPIVLSHEGAKHCGLLVHPARGELLIPMPVSLKGVVDVDSAWTIRAERVGELRAAMLGALEHVKL
jgi:class 3 adenylate cyclase